MNAVNEQFSIQINLYNEIAMYQSGKFSYDQKLILHGCTDPGFAGKYIL